MAHACVERGYCVDRVLCTPAGALKSLNGAPPLIIGHRRLPGLYPKEVMPGYQAAICAGTDALEFDLQSSSDGVLLACHNVFSSDTTLRTQRVQSACRSGTRNYRRARAGLDSQVNPDEAARFQSL
jgi:glycerophosphoryl diester phosphodiesterase